MVAELSKLHSNDAVQLFSAASLVVPSVQSGLDKLLDTLRLCLLY